MLTRRTRILVRFFFILWRQLIGLLARDDDFGGGDFQPDHAMVGVEIEDDCEVGGGDAKAVERFSVGGDRAGGLDGDGAGSQFLRDEHRESLLAAFGPVIETRKNRVLIVEIVVQDGDERSVESERLLEGASAFHLQSDFGDAICEGNIGAILFVGLRGPFVSERSAVGLQSEVAGYARG